MSAGASEQGDQLSLLPSQQHWWERAIIAVPAAAALSIAALYAVGALVKAAQLQGADLTIRDTLPLLSLETILGAGIGVVVQSLAVLALAAVVSIAAPPLIKRTVAASDRQREKEDRERKELREEVERLVGIDDRKAARTLIRRLQRDLVRERRRRIQSFVALIVGLAAVVVAILISSPVLSVAFGIALSIPFVFITFSTKEVRRKLLPYYVFVQFLILLSGFVASAFIYPDPLPRVELHLTNSNVMPGQLIVATDHSWYLARGGRVVAIPWRNIERAKFETVHRPEPRSTGDRMWDWLNDR